MFFQIPRLYESHTHFRSTGEFLSGLNLHNLAQSEQILDMDLSHPNYRRDKWIVGFGWNEKNWQRPPHKEILDKMYPDQPLFLSRIDGHQSWLNSAALKELNLKSETGLLIEKEHLWAWDNLPDYTVIQMKSHLESACRIYNKAGFTHVRDMSCSPSLWNLLIEMSEAGTLTVAIEENVTVHDLKEIDEAIEFCLVAKKNETPLLKMKGIKIFFDGTLGSETAYLSQPYYGKEAGPRGRPLWEVSDLQEAMKKTWASGLEFSVHVIGDEAAHQVVQAARNISARGSVGRLNLEHVEVLRNDTIQLMKPLHVRCHIQPCHWLSDRAWLKEKLGSLYQYAFPWEALRAAKIPFSFGCDSPIEPPSYLRNVEALLESPKEKIKKLGGDMNEYHSHPDINFAHSVSTFENGELRSIEFCGRQLDLS